MFRKQFFSILVLASVVHALELNALISVGKVGIGDTAVYNINFRKFTTTIGNALSKNIDALTTAIVNRLNETYEGNITAIQKKFCDPLGTWLMDLNDKGFAKLNDQIKDEINNKNPGIKTFFIAMKGGGAALKDFASDDEPDSEKLTGSINFMLTGFSSFLSNFDEVHLQKMTGKVLVALQDCFLQLIPPSNSGYEISLQVVGKLASHALQFASSALKTSFFQLLQQHYGADEMKMKKEFFCPIGLTLIDLSQEYNEMFALVIIEIETANPRIKDAIDMCDEIGNIFIRLHNDYSYGDQKILKAIEDTIQKLSEFVGTLKRLRVEKLEKHVLEAIQDAIFRVLDNGEVVKSKCNDKYVDFYLRPKDILRTTDGTFGINHFF